MKLIDKVKQVFKAKEIDVPGLNNYNIGLINSRPAPAPALTIVDYFSNWSGSCIKKRAETTSSINIYAVDEQGTALDKKHWINQLIRTPNTILNITRKQLISLIVKWLDYTGNCFLYLPAGSVTGKPSNIFVLPATRIKIKSSGSELIQHYEYTYNGKTTIYKPAEIIHIKTLTVDEDLIKSMLYGKPEILNSCIDSILTNKQKLEYQKKYYFSEGIAPLFLKTKQALTQEQADKLKADINSKLPDDSAVKGLITDDVEFLKLDLIDDNAISGIDEKENIKIIASNFGVPLGLLDTESLQNRATAETNYYMFRKDTIEPLLQLIESAFTTYLDKYEPGVQIVHNEYKPFSENELDKYRLFLEYGIITRNELRLQQGLPELANGNEPLVPASLNTWKSGTEQDDTTKQLLEQLYNDEISFKEFYLAITGKEQ